MLICDCKILRCDLLLQVRTAANPHGPTELLDILNPYNIVTMDDNIRRTIAMTHGLTTDDSRLMRYLEFAGIDHFTGLVS